MTSDEVTAVEIVVRSTDLGSDQYVRGEVYFTYFEQSRLEHLRRLEIVPRFPPPAEAPNYFAIVETTARYREAAHFGDLLLVVTRTAAVSNRSFTLAFEIRRSDTDTLVAEGRSVQVWLDADRQPAPIPAAFRARLEASIVGGT